MIEESENLLKVVYLMDNEKYEEATKLLDMVIKDGDELNVREELVRHLIKAGGCHEAYDECMYIIENLSPSQLTYMYLQNITFWLKKYKELKIYSKKRMEITKNLSHVSAQSQVAYCMACVYLGDFLEAKLVHNEIAVDDKNSELILFCENKVYFTSKSRIKKCIELKDSKELLSSF